MRSKSPMTVMATSLSPIGEPRPALTRGEKYGLLVRIDPQTHQFVGLTVLDYEKKFRQLYDIAWVEQQSLPTEIVDS